MGNISSEKYNKLDNVGISIKLNKVCYFPGEEITGNIIISPKIYSIEDHRKYCELIITINERSQYTYRRGSDTETEVDNKTLINHKLRFSDFIEFVIITVAHDYIFKVIWRIFRCIRHTPGLSHFRYSE